MKEEKSTEFIMWVGAMKYALIMGCIGILGAALFKGKSGFIGALFAQIIVVIFFAIHLLVSHYSRNLQPVGVMVMAVFSYVAKLIAMAIFLYLVLSNVPTHLLDRKSFGIVAVLITLAWLIGEIRAFLSLKLGLPLPQKRNFS